MTVPRPALVLLLAVGAELVCNAHAGAEEYRNPQYHFSVQLPAGWSQVTKNIMDQVNAKVMQPASGVTIRYIAGFQRPGPLPLQYPYVLVQPMPTPPDSNSYEDIERGLAKAFNTEIKKAVKQTEDRYAGLVKDMAVGQPVLDRANNQVVMRLEMSAAGQGKIKGLSVGFLGAKETVFLHCYALANDFEQQMPAFQSLLDSFKFESGYAFTPGSSSFVGKVGSSALHGAIVGAIIGLVAGPLILWRKLRKPKDAPPGAA
jgi:hypothetical protein